MAKKKRKAPKKAPEKAPDGATTANLRVAVTEAGFKSSKGISRAMAIARDKFEKEGIMKKKTKAAKKEDHRDEMAKLREDIAGLRKEVRSLDKALRKEQSAAKSKKRAALMKKIRTRTLRLAKLVACAGTFPVRHPVRSVKAIGRAVKASACWTGRQAKRVTMPFVWLASKFKSDEAAEATA